ncbi:MAG TPA: hypothetical protein VGS22_18610 [Thermoanaerobaculia bacterium]|jgi:hypothetical protein|nr:hypothetical protein [Thermoanaerobaculia bacterium]
MRTRWTLLALGLAIAFSMAPPAHAKPQFSYAVKFVCGFNPENIGRSLDGKREGEPTVKLGNYATDINIYNPDFVVDPHNPQNQLFKKVLVLVAKGDQIIGREPKSVDASGFDFIALNPGEATMDDCNRIGELIYGSPVPFPYPLTIGFLVIQSVFELDVTAVYTAEICSAWAANGELNCLKPTDLSNGVSISQDVDQIEGKRLY